MKKNIETFTLNDGSSTGITTFCPEQYTAQTPVIVVFPAMGVAASYYESFAEGICKTGLIVITADIRGQGLSGVRPSSKSDFGYKDMLEMDYAGVLDKKEAIFPKHPLYLLGHSLGGQLACLYLSQSKTTCNGLIIIACCSVFYKGWDGFARVKTYFFTQTFGLIARLWGYFPGETIGFGGTGAKTQMIDWSNQARTGKYLPKNSNFDYEKALAELKIPVLAISLKEDNFAPKKAVQLLTGKLHPESRITHLHLSKEDLEVEKATHFSWVKNPGNMIKRLGKWIT